MKNVTEKFFFTNGKHFFFNFKPFDEQYHNNGGQSQ